MPKQQSKGVRVKRKNTKELWQGKHRSSWSFWKDGVSSSLLSLFLSCREQFRLEVVEGWRSRTEPLFFGFGTCGHWILEKAYGRLPIPNEKWLNSILPDYHKQWEASVKMPTAKQYEQQTRIYRMMRALMPTYFKRWAGDWSRHRYSSTTGVANPVEWVALEKRFEVPYVFPDGETVPIRGTRDGIFKDKRGKLWIIDSKFRSIIKHDDIIETMEYDLQQMLYLWAATQELIQLPAGTILNVVRRPGQILGKNELEDDYYSRMREDIENPKRWDHYFMRFELAVVIQDIRRWQMLVLDPLMHDVRAWWEGSTSHYMNPNSLVSKYGRCPMFIPITKGNMGGCYRRTGGIMDYQGL